MENALTHKCSTDSSSDQRLIAHDESTAYVSGRRYYQIAACINRPRRARRNRNIGKLDRRLALWTEGRPGITGDLMDLVAVVASNNAWREHGNAPSGPFAGGVARVLRKGRACRQYLIVAAAAAAVCRNEVLRLLLNKPAVRTAGRRLARELWH
jgi:hypothetical protein